MSNQEYDIIIVGGGLAGLALRRAVMDTPWRVLHLHKDLGQAGKDNRGLALTRSSHCILQKLGAWPQCEAAEIRRIKISFSGQFGSTCISDQDLDGGPLGYVLPAHGVLQSLLATVPPPIDASVVSLQAREDRVLLEAETATGKINYSTSLLLACDGTDSPMLALAGHATRPTAYAHKAIVCELHGSYDDPGLAVEHLTANGPVAVLPLGNNKSKLVYCVHKDSCDRVANMGEREFISLLLERHSNILPDMTGVGSRHTWPLYRHRHEGVGRILPIGNAALTIHPNAAQGYNLCLRDIIYLAEHLKDCVDPGAADVLDGWKSCRRPDRNATSLFVNTLASFYEPSFIPAPLYGLGLAAVDLLPQLKRGIAWRAAGLAAGQLPAELYASSINNC